MNNKNQRAYKADLLGECKREAHKGLDKDSGVEKVAARKRVERNTTSGAAGQLKGDLEANSLLGSRKARLIPAVAFFAAFNLQMHHGRG